MPEQRAGLEEILDGGDRLEIGARVTNACVGNRQVDGGGKCVDDADDKESRFRIGIQTDCRQVEDLKDITRHFRLDQNAAQHNAQNDGYDCQTFDPTIGDNQFFRWKKFGENAVLGRRICCCADADDGVGQKRVGAEKHEQTAKDFDRIGDEHHAALGHQIGEDADPGGQSHIT